ncbi:Pycsar system effector family protein [Flavobacterium sp.]|uniref:Pycsar system effector family protein n=3 Tax=Flavobacterium sp. TaxID=239 RepID=UPI0040331F7D
MDIVQKAESHVFHLFKDKLSPDYIYHNFNHTLRVVNNAAVIAKEEGIEDDMEIIMLAAWFHDTGYVDGPDNHEDKGAETVLAFLNENGYPEDKAEQVAALIRATKADAEPRSLNEKIIKDADCSHFADKNYCALSELLREEWKIQGKTFSDKEWALGNRKMLMQEHRFYTDYGKKELQPLKEANIAILQKEIGDADADGGKKKSKEKLNKKKLEKLERPDRGVDTVFRVTLNNHTRLSEIADSKANILLSVNAIIISIVLTTIIPKLDSPSNAHLVTPTLILMAFTVATIIFAILSTRPKVTSGTFTREDIDQQKVNLLFFGNFYKMPLEEYEWAMNEMMKSRDYLYGSMIKDLYFLGLVLHRKYRLLRITYTVFMIGILASVGAFIYAFKMV